MVSQARQIGMKARLKGKSGGEKNDEVDKDGRRRM